MRGARLADPEGVAALTTATVVNALNNLLGYPHGQDEELARRVPGSRNAIAAVLERLLAAGV